MSLSVQLQIGTAVLEITAEAHRLRGVYAKIISTGEVSTGDVIHEG